MNVAPSARTSSYSSSVASTRCVQFGSAHSQTNSVASASNRCALSAMRSFTSRKSASVWARLTLSSSIVASLRFVSRSDNATYSARGYACRVESWPEPVERVAAVLRAQGVDARIEEFPQGTPTARPRRDAVGCEPAQIVKSLVFVCDGLPVLALVPGDRRADAAKIAAAAGAALRAGREARGGARRDGLRAGRRSRRSRCRASARVLLERELLRHELVWAGAGSPRHVVGHRARRRSRASTNADIVDLSET